MWMKPTFANSNEWRLQTLGIAEIVKSKLWMDFILVEE